MFCVSVQHAYLYCMRISVYAHDTPPRVQHFSAFNYQSFCVYLSLVRCTCIQEQSDAGERHTDTHMYIIHMHVHELS